MNAPVEVSLPSINIRAAEKDGTITSQWYRFFESLLHRTGGSNDAIAINANSTITAGNGLTATGTVSEGIEIDAKQDTGWTAASGAGDKTAYSQYAGQNVSAGYVEAEAQQTDDAVKALSARLVALEAAIRANGGIDG